MTPFYIAGGYPDTFGKTFFEFLRRNASKASFESMVGEKPIKNPTAKKVPSIQKRHYRLTVCVSGIMHELALHVGKLCAISNPQHAGHVGLIQEALNASFSNGQWTGLRRGAYPLNEAKSLLEQAHSSPFVAETLASHALAGTGPFKIFQYPTSAIQLAAENPSVKAQTDACLDSGRTLGNEGELVYPPIEGNINVKSELPFNSSNITESIDQDSLVRKIFHPDRLFPDPEENRRFLNQSNSSFSENELNRSFSESDISSIEKGSER